MWRLRFSSCSKFTKVTLRSRLVGYGQQHIFWFGTAPQNTCVEKDPHIDGTEVQKCYVWGLYGWKKLFRMGVLLLLTLIYLQWNPPLSVPKAPSWLIKDESETNIQNWNFGRFRPLFFSYPFSLLLQKSDNWIKLEWSLVLSIFAAFAKGKQNVICDIWAAHFKANL